MRALRFVGAGQPLTLLDVPHPDCTPGWVVVDVHILHGRGSAWVAETPITLGHEVAVATDAVATAYCCAESHSEAAGQSREDQIELAVALRRRCATHAA
jgi:hypothetical protein